ncbi:MAG: diguanylate cyclase [Candidatus Krumholzibacteriia bacterium]
MNTADNESVIRRLYEISAEYSAGFSAQIQAMLQVGLERFGLDIGILSRIRGDRFELLHVRGNPDFNLKQGTILPLGETYGKVCLSAGAPIGMSDLSAEGYREDPAYDRWGLEAYLGVPVTVDGEIYGTLSFSSPNARPVPFTRSDLDILGLMASWLGSEISRREKEEALRKAEESFRKGIEASPAGMIMVDQRGAITYANRQALAMFDYDFAELLGTSIEVLVQDSVRGEHVRRREDYMEAAAAREMGKGRHLDGRRKDGMVFPVEVGLNPLDTPYGTYILCTVLDLTERRKFEEQILEKTRKLQETNRALAEQALRDSLTGLANRRGLFAQTESILRLARRGNHPTSLLMLDVDHFKEFNDAHGHLAGDEALKAVAGVLGEAARRSDVVARYGGEEFVILLPETGAAGARDVAERIRTRVAALGGLPRPLTASIGVATLGTGFPDEDDVRGKTDLLLHMADEALYLAKENGRNRVETAPEEQKDPEDGVPWPNPR